MEEFLLVGLRFAAAEIKAWLATRDWSKAGFSKPEIGKRMLEQHLPLVATERGLDKLHMLWNQAMREKVFGYVANLADLPDDPVADYVASSLTKVREVVRLGAEDF
jgi:hypothetical protein